MRKITLKEKYPQVFARLEYWSKEMKPYYKERLLQNQLADFEYIIIMNRLCLTNKTEVDSWINNDEE